MTDKDYIDKAVAIVKKNGGCGKTFPKDEYCGDRHSVHGCTCGFNKWNYLCPDCEAKKNTLPKEAEERIRLLKQIEILKEYNPEIKVKQLIAQLKGMCKYDDVNGTFDVVLIDGKNINNKDANCEEDENV